MAERQAIVERGATADLSTSIRLTPTEKRTFWGSFGGWAMDGFNWTVFGLVLAPTMQALLPKSGIEATPDNIGWYGEIGAALFLLGWGFSFIWGPIADRWGRKPAMTASILIYGVFTGLAGLATNVWEWNAFRFIAAIGIGGEWAMAGTIVSEVMPERIRARFGGLMHSAAYVGVLVVSVVYLLAGTQLGWRGMFFVGVFPALAVFAIRRLTPEPSRWKMSRAQQGPTEDRSFWAPVREAFSRDYRIRTWGNLALLVVCVIGLWAGSTYVPTAVTDLADAHGYSHGTVVHLASLSSMTVAMFTIIGCFVVPRLVAAVGRRRGLVVMFALMVVGTVGAYGIAYPLGSLPLTFLFLPVLGLGGASFAIFTIWLPEQYPTRLRATAFALTTTLSRWVAAAGTFLIGFGIHTTGSLTVPLSLTAIVFLVGMPLVALAPETKNKALPS